MADLWVANYFPPCDLLLQNKLDYRIELIATLNKNAQLRFLTLPAERSQEFFSKSFG
jgi:hypothetical protein